MNKTVNIDWGNLGFNYIKTYGDFKLEPPKEDSERVFFVCKK